MAEPGFCLALGAFDGLHLGHQNVLRETGKGPGRKAALLFTEHPAAVLAGVSPPALLTGEDREALLARWGIQPVYLDFAGVRDLSAEAFFSEILQNRLHATALCCGENYTFGQGGRGDASLLKTLCEAAGVRLHIAETAMFDGAPVSSSRIRRALQAGDVPAANAMLGRPFSYAFEVVAGDRRGRKLRFPTINQFFPAGFVRPKYGVYASRVRVGGALYPAVTNFGVRPTIGTNTARSETCILDYSGDLYGQRVRVELLYYLRPEKKFPSLDALSAAIARDAARAREYVEKACILGENSVK